MAFGLSIFDVAPGLRLMGDSVAYAYKFTKKGGQGDGSEGLEIGLTDDPTVKLLEAAVSGYEQVADRDSVYTQLVSGGLTELVPGLALHIDSLSSIDTDDNLIRLALAGSQPLLQFRKANVQAVTKVGDSGYVWDLPVATFAALKTAAEGYESNLEDKLDAMIAARISADGVLQAALDAQAVSDTTARAAIQADVDQNEADADAAIAAEIARVDALIATDMWLFATQADFPSAADNHGRVVHSHADASMFYAHGGMWHKIEREDEAQAARDLIQADVDQNESDADAAIAAEATTRETNDNTIIASVDGEATTREAADAALSGRLDVLEADPTTATAVAAVQADVDQNEADSDAAEAALSARLDVLEADPTTATAVAAVQADVDQNEADSDAAIAVERGRIDAILASADADKDTFVEIVSLINSVDTENDNAFAAYVISNDAAVAAVQADVDQNESDSDAAEAALSGRLDVLEADPTTATALAAVQADVDQNESDADAADSALSGRLDVLEADPTTATALAAVQADVDQNETDGDAADAALSARLDTLEADPTTATAVAAVQADVDQNEADADAAIALKAPLADPDFTGQLEVDTNARLEFDSNLTKLHNVLRGTSIQIGNNIQLYPAAADGRVEIEGGLYLRPSDIGNYANDTDAAAGGVVVGGVYHHNGTLRIRLS